MVQNALKHRYFLIISLAPNSMLSILFSFIIFLSSGQKKNHFFFSSETKLQIQVSAFGLAQYALLIVLEYIENF